MLPPRRYQVFLSSTFTDLQEERIAITQALLKTQKCFPTGMELFPASSRPPWDVIRPLLDHTDYLILLIGGRYGSVDEQGISYTEREYDYAYSQDTPVIAFSRQDVEGLPETQRETDPLMQGRLARFKNKVRGRHTVQSWSSPDKLTIDALTSLYQEFEVRPRAGWIRGAAPEDATPELGELTRRADSTPAPDRKAPQGATPLQRLRGAVDALMAQVELGDGLRVDGDHTYVAQEHAARLSAIEAGMRPLLSGAFEAVRVRRPEMDRELVRLIRDLAPNRRLSGSTDLINLTRAPGVLLYHAVGAAASAADRDDLMGRLLNDQYLVDDPYRGEAPAVAALTPELVYPRSWPSKQLHQFLQPLLSADEAIGPRIADFSLARWLYVHSIQVEYLSSAARIYSTSWPYLKIEEAPGSRNFRTTIGKTLLPEVRELGEEHPLLRGGVCDGKYELFEAAAITFERNYCAWARERDWAVLPSGGGFLPSGPHFPGEH